MQRSELPNLGALNFLLHESLDGGGTLSLKADPQGKTYSSALLRRKSMTMPLIDGRETLEGRRGARTSCGAASTLVSMPA